MIRLALIFGGANSEHEVSIASARGVLGALDRTKYSVELHGIDRNGGWHRLAAVDDLLSVAADGEREPDIGDIDLAFPLIHGRYGEDGTLQGLLEMRGTPYVGSGVLASALAMDKHLTAVVLAAAGIPVVENIVVSRASLRGDLDRISAADFPVFVKPNRAGSSVGAHRVDSAAELQAAILDALSHDDLALVQPLQTGSEVDVGIIQLADGSPIAGAPLLIRPAAHAAFFDYEAKYTQGGADFEVPAVLPRAVSDNLVRIAKEVFAALKCEGLARIDFFVDSDGRAVVNEVNTLPGMSALSQLPRMFAATGMEFDALLDVLIERALIERGLIERGPVRAAGSVAAASTAHAGE